METFAIIEDDGGISLKVWLRKSLRNLNPNEDADFRIKGLNAKKVALAMLRKYPAKVLYVEGRRRERKVHGFKFL